MYVRVKLPSLFILFTYTLTPHTPSLFTHPHSSQPLTVVQIKHVQRLIEEKNEKAKEEVKVCDEERHRHLVMIGNILHPSVPVSNDEVKPSSFIFYFFNIFKHLFGNIYKT